MNDLRIGFLPLLDASILIAAHELGFAEQKQTSLTLVREMSRANVRDRISMGQFDAAHMLAPLPIAQNLGLSPLHVPLIVPFALGLGGSAITMSLAVAQAMSRHTDLEPGDPRTAKSWPAFWRGLNTLASARMSSCAVTPVRSRRNPKTTSYCSRSVRLTFHGKATRCGSIRRWCAGIKRRIPKRMSVP